MPMRHKAAKRKEALVERALDVAERTKARLSKKSALKADCERLKHLY